MREPGTRRWRFGRGLRRRRLTTIALLPTLITLGNLACGALSLFHAAEGFAIARGGLDFGQETSQHHYGLAAAFILLAMVFDALDGRVARLTRTASQFGAQLDSLCDLTSFGIAPAFLVHALGSAGTFAVLPARLVTVVCIFYAVCTAVRLARFNIETSLELKSHLDFAGLPSPASAGVVAAGVIPWTAPEEFVFLDSFSATLMRGLPIIVFLLAVLMVSRMKYSHVLNRLFQAPRPFVVFVEISLIGILAAVFHEFALFLGFAGYALSGPVIWVRTRLSRRNTAATPAAKPEESLF